jgi:23S rRNA pseudouridine1911/1915/1917 synthase
MEPEDIPLEIAYEDDELLVVNKPAGMVVHPAPGNYTGTLVNALLYHCKNLSGIGGVSKPGIVHRIDKGTSGLLLVAKTDRAHKSLSKQFKDKTINRVYVSIVKGVIELDNGTVELPIGRSPKDRKKMTVKFEDSKDALTNYRVLERFADATLLELVLGTGRTHQIRVHMSHMGHPIIGDEKYGYKDEGIDRPALHAKTIGFAHPVTGEYMEFTSELPPDMVKLIREKHDNKTGKKAHR